MSYSGYTYHSTSKDGQKWYTDSDGNSWSEDAIKGKVNTMAEGQGSGLIMDPLTASGQIAGRQRAEEVYGMSGAEMGTEVQDIVRRRRQALDGQDPATTRLQESKNQQLREAKGSGATSAQMRQIERSANADIGQQEFRNQEKALSDYQKLVGNIVGGTTSLEMGMASAAKAGEQVEPADTSDDGSVICTELHRQGYMTSEMLRKDSEYGQLIRLSDHLVYIGYVWLAMPIVATMKKSKLFTKVVSYPALAWAKDMAYDNSRVGKTINKVGQPVCRLVGSVITKFHNKGIIYV